MQIAYKARFGTVEIQFRPPRLRHGASWRHKIANMPNETFHDVYRTWAELTEAAKTDEKAWLFLVNFAPWATRLLEEPTMH